MRILNLSIISILFFIFFGSASIQAQELNKDKFYKGNINDLYSMINLPLPEGNWFVRDMALNAPEEKGFYLYAELASDDKFYQDVMLVVLSDNDSVETEYRKEYKVCTHPTNANEFQKVLSVTDRSPGSFQEYCSGKGNDVDPAQSYSFYIADCSEVCVEVSWFNFTKSLQSPNDDDFVSLSEMVFSAFKDGFDKRETSLAFTAEYIKD